MPRSKQARASNQDPIEKIPFKFFSFGTATSTSLSAPSIGSVQISPAFDTRLAAIADVYQYYRFSSLKLSLLPYINEVTADDAAVTSGYCPRVPNTAPTTHNHVIALPASTHKGLGQTMPTSFSVKKNVVIGDAPLKWYQSIAGTEDAQFEIQGIIYFAANGTNNPSSYTYILEGVCEFKGRSSPAMTPLYLQPLKSQDSPADSTPSDKDAQIVVIGGQKFKMVSA